MSDDQSESVPPPVDNDLTGGSRMPEEPANSEHYEASTVVDDSSLADRTILTGELEGTAIPVEQSAAVIGRYKLLKELGKGGFGMVWQAAQTEPMRREVALKIIKPGMDSAEIIARFEAERQALALMDHPNIASVYDAGTTDRGRPYFVMELVKGLPITEYCDTHQLGIRERLELFIPVCQAVQHAHQKAILHRDLKPSNILVIEVDGKPVPKVIDFGIAKALNASQEEIFQASLALTQAGMVVGTPQYMSPEQAGARTDMDTRSDIYTLGVILYELLTGQTPLSREALRQAALGEVLRMIREAEPARPSSRVVPITDAVRHTSTARGIEPGKLPRVLRGDLDWITLKALEKERERRYESAAALAQDLERHLRHQPVEAGPPSGLYRFRKLVRRNQLAVAAAAAITALLVTGIAVSTWQAVRAAKAEKLAEGRRMQAQAAAVDAGRSAKAEAIQRRKAEEAATLAESSAQAEAIQRHEAEEQTKKAEAAATQARENLSQSYFLQALRSIDERKDCDALAQLVRSLSIDPKNAAALYRLMTLLTYRDFALPVLSLKHEGRVKSARFSRDGKRIVTASHDGTARVWDAETGKPLAEPAKHDGQVNWAEFSPDGKWIATASCLHDEREGTSSNGAARVWDAETGKLLVELMANKGWVGSARFSPNGRQIVTASGDGTRVWDAETGKALTGLLIHENTVESAQFSPDGKRILSREYVGQQEYCACVWEVRTGRLLATVVTNREHSVESADFSPEGNRIITTLRGGTAQVWDAQTGKALGRPLQHEGGVEFAQFSPDGRRVLTESSNGIVRAWDAQSAAAVETIEQKGAANSVPPPLPGKGFLTVSGKTVRVWKAENGAPLTEPLELAKSIESSELIPDRTRIVTTASDEIARVWDCKPGKAIAGSIKHGGIINSAQFSADGKRFVTGSRDGTARVWDVETGKPLTEPIKHDSSVESAEFSPDGTRIVTAARGYFTGRVARGGAARVWDAKTGQALTEPMKKEKEIGSARFSPDGRWILTAERDYAGGARVWDAETGDALTGPMGDKDHGGARLFAQLSPDGNRVVTASEQDKTAQIWDAKTGNPLAEPMKHEGTMRSAQFSPDGKRIVTASADQTARVWDAETGKPLAVMNHEERVSSAEFSPDGKRIVTGAWGVARIWEADTGKALTEPMKVEGIVETARFSPDGRLVVTSSTRQSMQIWDASTGKPLTEALPELLHQDDFASAQFSPDGKRIVTKSDDGTARIWDVMPESKIAPEWLARLATAVAGESLNERGVVEPLGEDPGQVLEEIRAQLNRAAVDDDWVTWGRWFLADRSTRAISPFSKIKVPEYIENRINENTRASLDEAERLAIGNLEFLKRIAMARARLN